MNPGQCCIAKWPIEKVSCWIYSEFWLESHCFFVSVHMTFAQLSTIISSLRACIYICLPVWSRNICILHLRFMFNFVTNVVFCQHTSDAGVHDSFWVHACDVDQMNQILRQQFVELYSMPILENVCHRNYCLHIFLKLLHSTTVQQ